MSAWKPCPYHYKVQLPLATVATVEHIKKAQASTGDETQKEAKPHLWSSRLRSSCRRRRRFPTRCWRCRDWSTARGKCSSGSRSWCPPSPGCSGTLRDDRLRDRSTRGPDSPLRTHTVVSALRRNIKPAHFARRAKMFFFFSAAEGAGWRLVSRSLVHFAAFNGDCW